MKNNYSMCYGGFPCYCGIKGQIMNKQKFYFFLFLLSCFLLACYLAYQRTQPIKAANKGYCVTLYNHDGTIRGQYHNVTRFLNGESIPGQYAPSTILHLPEYGVYINSDYVISPEKD